MAKKKQVAVMYKGKIKTLTFESLGNSIMAGSWKSGEKATLQQ